MNNANPSDLLGLPTPPVDPEPGATVTEAYGDFSVAFDVCRERGRPIIVEIVPPADEPGRYKIFPSGRADRIGSPEPSTPSPESSPAE